MIKSKESGRLGSAQCICLSVLRCCWWWTGGVSDLDTRRQHVVVATVTMTNDAGSKKEKEEDKLPSSQSLSWICRIFLLLVSVYPPRPAITPSRLKLLL